MSIKLSVITITYNNYSGLKRTFNSIKDLLFLENVEWLVVDSQSSDESNPFITNLKNVYFNINYIYEKDYGIYDAMNKGIYFSKGTFLWFLNAGDICYLKNIEELDFSGFQDINVFNVKALDSDLNETYWKGLSVSKYKLTEYPSIPHQGTLFKRYLFEKYGLYDKGFKFVADYEKYCYFLSVGASFVFYQNIILAGFVYDGVSSKYENAQFVFKEISEIQKKYFGKVNMKMKLFYSFKFLLSKVFSKKVIDSVRPIIFKNK